MKYKLISGKKNSVEYTADEIIAALKYNHFKGCLFIDENGKVVKAEEI